MSLRVLLVEDDRELRADAARAALAVEGYARAHAPRQPGRRTRAAGPCRRAHCASGAGIDLVLLDLGLPDGDGETLLAELAARAQATPVIVISAREADGQKIRLLDAGADDYLVKPFSIGELLARMRVALRHRGTHAAARRSPHYRTRRPARSTWRRTACACATAADVHLTPTEFKLLARLVRSAGQVVTHRQLLADVWGAEFTEHTHYLRLYMGQLRAKLESEPAEPQRLLTEPGVGYRLVEAED